MTKTIKHDLIERAISGSATKRTDMEQLVLQEMEDTYKYYVKPFLASGKKPDFLYFPDTSFTRLLGSFDEIKLTMFRYAEIFDPENAHYLR